MNRSAPENAESEIRELLGVDTYPVAGIYVEGRCAVDRWYKLQTVEKREFAVCNTPWPEPRKDVAFAVTIEPVFAGGAKKVSPELV
jgi:hypothetical protein